MAVPKRRTSRSRTRHRRSRWKAYGPALTTVSVAGRRYAVPMRLRRAVASGLISAESLPAVLGPRIPRT